MGLSGPALGGREAPAVWVPLAPSGSENPGANRPIVLVPFQETLYVPDPDERPSPWVPDYLVAPGPGLRDGAAQSGRDVRRVETGPLGGPATAPAKVRSFTLSDVLRDVDWRRQTAKRLRKNPAFKPRF